MALNFHELYVLLEIWRGEERGEVTSTLLKARVRARVFALVIGRELGGKKKKRKKNNRKSLFFTSLKPTSLGKKIARQVEFRSLPSCVAAQGCGIKADPGGKKGFLGG